MLLEQDRWNCHLIYGLNIRAQIFLLADLCQPENDCERLKIWNDALEKPHINTNANNENEYIGE